MTRHTHQRFMAKVHDREPYKADCPACKENAKTTHTPGSLDVIDAAIAKAEGRG